MEKRVLEEKILQLKQLQLNEDINNTEAIKILDGEINALMEQDDLKWRQIAKKSWYNLGDKNTKYFHLCATQRQRKNKINSIINDQGLIVSSWSEIEEVFHQFF